MELYKKLNLLIKEKNLNKKNFAIKLIALEPKLKSTGEIPTIKTIYGYLSGDIALKIELIPYIAEVLEIPEQNQKITIPKDRFHTINDLLIYAPEIFLQNLENTLKNYKDLTLKFTK